MQVINALGRRKRAIARVYVIKGFKFSTCRCITHLISRTSGKRSSRITWQSKECFGQIG